MTTRFVALDLGNVLCDLDPPAFARRLGALTSTTAAQVEQAVFGSGAWQRLEVGDAPAREFRAAVLGALGASLDDDTFDDAWCLIPTPRPGADALVDRLVVPHAIWSNTDPIHARHLARTLDAMRTARHLNLSFAIQAAKPRARFYQTGLEALGVAPGEVLFVDDRAENVAAAQALGIQAHRAHSLPELAQILMENGLLRLAA
jgi:putative hydrolase of the HAD superfamily